MRVKTAAEQFQLLGDYFHALDAGQMTGRAA
jgi:hypothetical protein